MRYCVRALRSMTALGSDLVNQDLCNQGAIEQLLGNRRVHRQMDRREDRQVVDRLLGGVDLGGR